MRGFRVSMTAHPPLPGTDSNRFNLGLSLTDGAFAGEYQHELSPNQSHRH
jgi:hypothetical protein